MSCLACRRAHSIETGARCTEHATNTHSRLVDLMSMREERPGPLGPIPLHLIGYSPERSAAFADENTVPDLAAWRESRRRAEAVLEQERDELSTILDGRRR